MQLSMGRTPHAHGHPHLPSTRKNMQLPFSPWYAITSPGLEYTGMRQGPTRAMKLWDLPQKNGTLATRSLYTYDCGLRAAASGFVCHAQLQPRGMLIPGTHSHR